ncbi:hypothetical protein ABEH00_10030 [Pantoea agglomerans]|uniref:hypothetical protein n=1 Tax=Enterobacter agglomerans TaxID=549 RepID=UPI0016547697|nr:hypothetical protein [Pantoea agglomerans]MBD8157218.1 hypothetical protein [Pantoea agglomerans]MBD8234493.1 hypothetical protein [Pantoea agglomerans]
MTDIKSYKLTPEKIAEAARNRIKAQSKHRQASEKATEQEVNALTTLAADDKARHNLTFLFLKCFFGLFVGAWIFILIYNWSVVCWIIWLNEHNLSSVADKIPLLELDKLLSLIISALGTSLGFIIGYYFKNKDK